MAHGQIIFRAASLSDAESLFNWRMDPVTRHASKNIGKFSFDDHLFWLKNSISDANRTLLIAEIDGAPIGTIRFDDLGEETEVSWTIGPAARRKTLGTKMVYVGCNMLNSRTLLAKIKPDNIASIKIADRCGFKCDGEANGLMHFRRTANSVNIDIDQRAATAP